MNGNINCSEINIQGDSVWGIFDTPLKSDIDYTFGTAAQISSVIDTLNCKYKKKSIDPITVGIGMDYGRALMIKAGYIGSGINDVVWMGEVVNYASKLCSYGNKEWGDKEVMVSNVIQNNLNEHNQKLLEKNYNRNCYHGYVVNTEMDEWIKQNCK